MHPVLLILPAVALLLGPRLWVESVRRRHDNAEIEGAKAGGELARELLDSHGLDGVQVDRTDIGDHYDPKRKAVRLSRDNYERRSVAALAAAAHEVGHALQDASGFAPFQWRADLVRVARGTAGIGSVLLVATPVAALLTRNRLPPMVIGSVAFAVIGTGVAAQLAALPTEWDASFRRALPMLEAGYLDERQMGDARQMLLACSLTYVAASLASALQLWPWLPRPAVMLSPVAVTHAGVRDRATACRPLGSTPPSAAPRPPCRHHAPAGAALWQATDASLVSGPSGHVGR